MIRVAVRSVSARWSRALATSVAVVAGVAVVSGTLILSDTADRLGVQHEGLDVLRVVLPIAGAVALLVGGFIVNLTLTVTVAQRRRELALLRCLGATARQIRRIVILESLIIGAIAALIGVLAGFGVAAGARRLVNTEVFPGDLPGTALVLTPRTVLAALLLGCMVTTLSGWAVARRAGRLAPLAALRDATAGVTGRPGILRTATGLLTIALAVLVGVSAVRTGTGQLLIPAGGLAVVGARLAGPRFAPALAATVGWPVGRLLRLPGELGARNAARHPYRFVAVASAVLIGVTLMGLVTVVLTSIRVAMKSDLDRYRADYEIQALDDGPGISPRLVAELRALPELAAVVPEACTPHAVAAGEDLVCAADPAGLLDVFDLEVVAGQFTTVSTGGIAVNAVQARTEGWTIGSPVTVRLPGGARTFPVTAIYRGFYYLGAPIIAPDEYARLGGDPAPTTIYIRAAVGVDEATARKAVDRTAAAADPVVQVTTRAEVRAANLDQIDAATWVYRGLTGLAIMVGLVGIFNVLALSTVERRRELGVLRAIGLERGQVRSMVRAEAAVIATVGVGAGTGLGLLFGWAATRVLENASQPIRFAVPAGTLAVIAAAAVGAALVAAAVPAAWASRLPVLRTE